VEDKLEARAGIIAGLRERLTTLTTGEGSELARKLAEEAHAVTIFAEQAVQMGERLQVTERKAEEERKK